MKELIKELREWAKKCGLEDEPEIEDMGKAFQDFDEILSRHSAEVEPLAVLADRKGWWVEQIQHFPLAKTWCVDIHRSKSSSLYESYECFEAPTYAEAEAKAREWLNKLEDK